MDNAAVAEQVMYTTARELRQRYHELFGVPEFHVPAEQRSEARGWRFHVRERP